MNNVTLETQKAFELYVYMVHLDLWSEERDKTQKEIRAIYDSLSFSEQLTYDYLVKAFQRGMAFAMGN